MNLREEMFGKYELNQTSGINPPAAPTYPAEWGFSSQRVLEIMTRIDPEKVKKLFEYNRLLTSKN